MNVQLINEAYFDDNPFSFGGKYKLVKQYGSKNEEIIDDALEQNDIYSRFKEYKRARKFSPIYIYAKRELFQADVGFIDKEYAEASGGYKYIFAVIDCFTKYSWVYPLKANTANSAIECFKDVLSRCGQKPEMLNTDRGSEFKNKAFAKYMKDEKIHHYFSYSDRKCPIVERFMKTIQQKIYKICAQKRTLNWITALDQALKIYLTGYHSTIKMSPREAEKEERQTELVETYAKTYAKADEKPQKAKFKVGDTVRIYYKRHAFHRAYDENFTREYFTITEVLDNLPVIRYKLKDYSGEPIVGSFFQNELVPYKHSLDGADDIWEANPIAERINRRTKKKQYKMNWVGWPSKYDEWVDSDNQYSLQN